MHVPETTHVSDMPDGVEGLVSVGDEMVPVIVPDIYKGNIFLKSYR